jgi:hypothetical protein
MTTAFKFKDDHAKKLERKAEHEKAMEDYGIADSGIHEVDFLGEKERLLAIKDDVYNQIDRFEDTLMQANTFKTTEGFPAIHLAQNAEEFRY